MLHKYKNYSTFHILRLFKDICTKPFLKTNLRKTSFQLLYEGMSQLSSPPSKLPELQVPRNYMW